MKFNAGFIYVAPNCDPKQQNAVIPGESIDLYVYGCSTYSQAEVVAKSLVEEKGCTAIELCAGFGNDGIARIQKVVGPDVAVGAVKFDLHPAFGFKSGDTVFASHCSTCSPFACCSCTLPCRYSIPYMMWHSSSPQLG